MTYCYFAHYSFSMQHANESYNDQNTIQLKFNSRTQVILEFNVKEIEYGPSQPALILP